MIWFCFAFVSGVRSFQKVQKKSSGEIYHISAEFQTCDTGVKCEYYLCGQGLRLYAKGDVLTIGIFNVDLIIFY